MQSQDSTGLHLIFTSNYRHIKAALTFGTDDVVQTSVLDSEVCTVLRFATQAQVETCALWLIGLSERSSSIGSTHVRRTRTCSTCARRRSSCTVVSSVRRKRADVPSRRQRRHRNAWEFPTLPPTTRRFHLPPPSLTSFSLVPRPPSSPSRHRSFFAPVLLPPSRRCPR